MNHLVRIVAVQVEPHPRRVRKPHQDGATKGARGTRQTDLLVIATDLLDLEAERVALIYQYRYTVELFFRVLKQLLGLRHLISQRPPSVPRGSTCRSTAR